MAVDGIDVEVRTRRGLRVPRAQRRRQVLDDADGRLRLAGHRGRAEDLRPRPGPSTDRRSAPGSAWSRRRTPSTRSSRSRRTSGSTAATSACRAPRSRARADELLEFAQLSDRRDGQGRPAVRRHEAAPHHRPLADQRARACSCSTSPPPASTRRRATSLWDRLFRLKRQGVTLVVTTHYMDEAEQLCDRLVVMDKGRIVAEGSPRELIDAHSTREVARAAVRRRRARRGDRGAPSPGRRPGRGAARPHPRLRDDGDGPRAVVTRPRDRAALVLVRRSRWRTSSSTSPVGPWSTEWRATTPPAPSARRARPAPPAPAARGGRRYPDASTGGPGAAAHRPFLRRSSSCCPWGWAWGAGRRARPAASAATPPTCCSSSPGLLGRRRRCGWRWASRPGRCSATSSGTGLPRACWPRRSRPDILVGHLRSSVVTIVALGDLHGRRGAVRRVRVCGRVLGLPVAVLIGLAFAAPITAFTAAQENDTGFNVLFRLGHDAADALLRHLLPDQPAARMAAARSRGSPRSGTASRRPRAGARARRLAGVLGHVAALVGVRRGRLVARRSRG